jgi:hypothetical protein
MPSVAAEEYIRAMAANRAVTRPGPDAVSGSGGDEGNEERQIQRRPAPAQGGGGVVYGLGLIGALIWYWRQADGPGGRALGVLKAFVWPAFLVYGAFEALRNAAPTEISG